MRVRPEPFVQLKGLSAVMRLKQGSWGDANIETVGIGTRSDLPDVLERFFCIRRHFDATLFGIVPCRAHIGALYKLSSKIPARRASPDVVAPLTLIKEGRIHSQPGEMRTTELPF